MALVKLSTVDGSSTQDAQQLAAQEQRLKTALSRVGGLRVVADTAEAGAGAKSGPGSALGFALEVVDSPHVISAVGVVLFEWLRHNLGKSIELVIEGEKNVVESGSSKHVRDLVHLLEQKLKP